jgi:uncharacterized membrane protein YeaQ/YmgE (transglycosylase-associated protein family)
MGFGAIALWFLFLAILFGAVLGALSGFLVKRRDPGSIITRMLIGFFGGIIAIVIIAIDFDLVIVPPIEAIGIIAGGAVLLLFIYSLIVDKRKTT